MDNYCYKADGIALPSFTADNLVGGIESAEHELVIKNSAVSLYAGGSDTVPISFICDPS